MFLKKHHEKKVLIWKYVTYILQTTKLLDLNNAGLGNAEARL